ncbi:hypothetical protein LSAT2_006773 [Lamellibrachia satsuma]|nr:hypothetical protein LSAT2_006773 [Lamellibrachia satsuma]
MNVVGRAVVYNDSGVASSTPVVGVTRPCHTACLESCAATLSCPSAVLLRIPHWSRRCRRHPLVALPVTITVYRTEDEFCGVQVCSAQ